MSNLLGITDIVLSLVGLILYPLFSVIFWIIDMSQNIFTGFAGLGTIKMNGAVGNSSQTVTNTGGAGDAENGIVYYLLRHKTVQNIFFSMLILAVFLLIIFTVMAFIKNVYQAKPKKWQDIFTSTFKGAINFVFIPVCCLLGVIAGNFLLKTLYDATAQTTDVGFSRMLFIASAYNANVFRSGGGLDAYQRLYDLYDETEGFNTTLVGSSRDDYNPDKDATYADLLDDIYRSKNGPNIYVYQDLKNYNLWEINYLFLVAGGVFIIYALLRISFGLVKRLFMLMLLYVISPLVCALFPFDDGKAVGSWRGEFVKQFFSAFGAVMGMNLFFLLVPLLNSINLGWGDVVGFVPLLITIAGLYMVTDFIKLVSSFIPGGADIYSEGANLSRTVVGGLKKKVGQTVKAGTTVAGWFQRARGAQRANDEYFMKKVGADELIRKEGESASDYRKRIKNLQTSDPTRYSQMQSDIANARQNAAPGEGGPNADQAFLKTVRQSTLDMLTSSAGIGKISDIKSGLEKDEKAGFDATSSRQKYAKLLKDDERKYASARTAADEAKKLLEDLRGKSDITAFSESEEGRKWFKDAARLLGGSNGEAVLRAFNGSVDLSNVTASNWGKFLTAEGFDSRTAKASEIASRMKIISSAHDGITSVGESISDYIEFQRGFGESLSQRAAEVQGALTGITDDQVTAALTQLSKGIRLTATDADSRDYKQFVETMNAYYDEKNSQRENLVTNIKNAQIKVEQATKDYQEDGGTDSSYISNMKDITDYTENIAQAIEGGVNVNIEGELTDLTNSMDAIERRISELTKLAKETAKDRSGKAGEEVRKNVLKG